MCSLSKNVYKTKKVPRSVRFYNSVSRAQEHVCIAINKCSAWFIPQISVDQCLRYHTRLKVFRDIKNLIICVLVISYRQRRCDEYYTLSSYTQYSVDGAAVLISVICRSAPDPSDRCPLSFLLKVQVPIGRYYVYFVSIFSIVVC